MKQGAPLSDYRSFFEQNNEIGYYRPESADKIAGIVTTDFERRSVKPASFSRDATLHYIDIEHERLALGDVLRKPFSGHIAYDWAKSKGQLLSSLVTVKNSRVVAFPHIKGLDESLDAMNPSEASQYPKDRMKKNEQGFSFLGQSYAGDLVALAVPSLILVTFLYFLVNLKHLNVLLVDEGENFKNFPWLGLFQDRISVTLTWISICILPLSAVISSLLFLIELGSSLFYFTLFILHPGLSYVFS